MNKLLPLSLVLLAGCGMKSNILQPAESFSAPSAASSVAYPAPRPAAFVYVVASAEATGGSEQTEIEGFSASRAGLLSPIAGSPFAVGAAGGSNTSIVVNGSYLFGANYYGANINSYAITPAGNGAASGALALVHTFDLAAALGIAPQQSGNTLFLDHAGQTLYVETPAGIASLAVGAGGELALIGLDACSNLLSDDGSAYCVPATFTANDQFAYGPLSAFARTSSGVLAALPAASTPPLALVAADPANNLAVAALDETGLPQSTLTSYQVSASGAISPSAFYVPVPVDGLADSAQMSPAGDFLALGTSAGVEVFAWHGAESPSFAAEFYAGANQAMTQVAWDGNWHLFALADTAQVYVWTVTAQGMQPVAGSPVRVAGTIGMAVQVVHEED